MFHIFLQALSEEDLELSEPLHFLTNFIQHSLPRNEILSSQQAHMQPICFVLCVLHILHKQELKILEAICVHMLPCIHDSLLCSRKLVSPQNGRYEGNDSLFFAADRYTYLKLIPQHLADCLTFSSQVQQCFQAGRFVASITGRDWQSVAVDEAHEILLNKHCKRAIVRVRPSREHVA